MSESFAAHPNAAVRGLAAGQRTAEEFREYLRAVGTPLVDAAPARSRRAGAPSSAQSGSARAFNDAEAVVGGVVPPGRAVVTPVPDAGAPDVRLVSVTFVRDLGADDAGAGASGAEGEVSVAITAGAGAVGSGAAADSRVAETRLMTLIDRALPPRGAFTPIPGTPYLVQTLELPADLRFTYLLGELGSDGTRRRIRDPYNPLAGDPKLGGSVAVLPQAAAIEVGGAVDAGSARDAAGAIGAGGEHHATTVSSVDSAAPLGAVAGKADAASRVTHLRFASEHLGNERDVWVSVPSGWWGDAGPYPFVVVFDGRADHGAPAVRDRLVEAGLARPCVVVLIGEAGRRDAELTGNPAFTRALVDELLPRLRREFALSGDPRDAVLSGKSFGGLCAGWTALEAPESFGNAIMQSPSAWFHPDLGLGSGGGHGSAGGAGGSHQSVPPEHADPVPLLIDAFAQTEAAPVRLYHECGTLEFGPPPAQIWQIEANRWLRRVLEAKGYDTVYHEFRGGHDAAWWDVTWARGLAWVLPAE